MDDINEFVSAILAYRRYNGKQMNTLIPDDYYDNCQPVWVKQQESEGLE
jgi:hypothetical protein